MQVDIDRAPNPLQKGASAEGNRWIPDASSLPCSGCYLDASRSAWFALTLAEPTVPSP
jgi:hypothetical protein